jgi:putative transposase
LDWVRYMVVDARYEKVRVNGLVRDCAVLIGYGVRSDGKRTVLGVSVSLSEAEIHWRNFFRGLKERGMHGLEMITSDAHSGLKAALKTEFGGVLWQRCQFHLQQNAGSYVAKIDMRKAVASDIRNVFNAPDMQEAERLLVIIVKKYEKSNGSIGFSRGEHTKSRSPKLYTERIQDPSLLERLFEMSLVLS